MKEQKNTSSTEKPPEKVSPIDFEKIFAENPELKEILDRENSISNLKDFYMRRMFEALDSRTNAYLKERNTKIINSIQEEIQDNEKKISECDFSVIREAELLKYKQNLYESGHISIVPSVVKYLEEIGEEMLEGKPVFLHGPTGTGKTSLARYAASHFTGKDAEMIYCSPQTKESNVWGKTGIKPVDIEAGEKYNKKDMAIMTEFIAGPLTQAITEGKVIIFDEFNSLPSEQMDFIKGVFGYKAGDMVPITGDHYAVMAPGFQMIFTANLKSEKHPEKQRLPNQVVQEFDQHNIKINYINKEESYDVMLSRLMNSDGSIDMSYYDLQNTLPRLAEVMFEIQESYTGSTSKEMAQKAGVLDVAGKTHSLKRFVMSQRFVDSVISRWLIRQKTEKKKQTFSELLDDAFKKSLTFEEYPSDDRILAAKILASKGFLLTLSPKDLGLPAEIFDFNTIKKMRGEDAVKELKEESSKVVHLNLKDLAELDPFGLRADMMRQKAEGFLDNIEGGQDEFLVNTKKRMDKVFDRKKKTENIAVSYGQEQINIDFEKKLSEFSEFYKKHNLDTAPDFEDSIKEIWNRNFDAIQKAIEEHGFDNVLFLPLSAGLPNLHEKMTEGYNTTWQGSNFQQGGSFTGAKSENTDKVHVVLVHSKNAQNMADREELKKTRNILGKDVDMDNTLTLEDYLIFQRKYFEENKKHLDASSSATWLATHSEARLVHAHWHPGDAQLYVRAYDLDSQRGILCARPSRSFF